MKPSLPTGRGDLPRQTARPATKARRWSPAKSDTPATGETPDAPELFEALRQWRLGEARRQQVPAFRILGNQTLLDIAASKPRTAAELLAVPGIGPARLKQYGASLLRIVWG